MRERGRRTPFIPDFVAHACSPLDETRVSPEADMQSRRLGKHCREPKPAGPVCRWHGARRSVKVDGVVLLTGVVYWTPVSASVASRPSRLGKRRQKRGRTSTVARTGSGGLQQRFVSQVRVARQGHGSGRGCCLDWKELEDRHRHGVELYVDGTRCPWEPRRGALDNSQQPNGIDR